MKTKSKKPAYFKTSVNERLKKPLGPVKLHDFLLCTLGYTASVSALTALSPLQQAILEDYAARVHLNASDNPVRVPRKPAVLDWLPIIEQPASNTSTLHDLIPHPEATKTSIRSVMLEAIGKGLRQSDAIAYCCSHLHVKKLTARRLAEYYQTAIKELPQITITISGPMAAGKSVLAHKVGAWLASANHIVQLLDDGGFPVPPVANWGKDFNKPRRINIEVKEAQSSIVKRKS